MSRSLPVGTLKLFTPTLEELTSVLQNGLQKSFAKSSVKVVDCPNLRNAPFYLAAEGLCGKERLVDVGGVKNLVPLAQKDKIYNLDSIAELIGLPGAFMIGAGAGPFHQLGVNSELMANVKTRTAEEDANNLSYLAKVNPKDGSCDLFQRPDTTDFALMLNLLASEGKAGKVIEVKASLRTEETNLITCMRDALSQKYGLQPVGLGGVFLVQRGRARLHIMPDFSSMPLDDTTVNEWLKYFDMSAPLVCLSVLVSHDPGLDLRVEHTHCFSKHGEGGHYHEDTTPDEVEYVGYFVPAETLFRVDQPE